MKTGLQERRHRVAHRGLSTIESSICLTGWLWEDTPTHSKVNTGARGVVARGDDDDPHPITLSMYLTDDCCKIVASICKQRATNAPAIRSSSSNRLSLRDPRQRMNSAREESTDDRRSIEFQLRLPLAGYKEATHRHCVAHGVQMVTRSSTIQEESPRKPMFRTH